MSADIGKSQAPVISTDKYESTGEIIEILGHTLYRIRAKRDFGDVNAGDLGGFIASEANLSPEGNAWVYGDAWVFGDAQVSGDARIYGNARVYGDAQVTEPILSATRSDGYTFVAVPTPHGPRIIAGCRYFTFDEARKHWTETRGGTQLGDESLALVDFLERMSVIRGFMEPVKVAAE